MELDEDFRPVISLFGESQGRILVSTSPDKTEHVLSLAAQYEVPAMKIGRVTDADTGFSVKVRGGSVSASTADISKAYFTAIPKIMDAPAGSEA